MTAAGETWTIRKVLNWTRQHFERQSIDSPRLTAELLLAHSLTTERVRLYMDLDRPLSGPELEAYRLLIKRRLANEPTQYLMGKKEFFGRTFHVDPRVLIPRPETELLVEACLEALPHGAPRRVLDLCTGSGCIAITLAAERLESSVWATDLIADALDVARQNAARHGVDGRVTFFLGDLFAPITTDARFDVVVSNPPYIATPELAQLQREVRQEPRAALDGGPDGLVIMRRLVNGAAAFLRPGGVLAVEIGEDQGAAVETLFHSAGLTEVVVRRDLARFDRLVTGRAPRLAKEGHS